MVARLVYFAGCWVAYDCDQIAFVVFPVGLNSVTAVF